MSDKAVCEQEVEFTAPLKEKWNQIEVIFTFYPSGIMRWILLPETHKLDLKAVVPSIVLSDAVKFFIQLT